MFLTSETFKSSAISNVKLLEFVYKTLIITGSLVKDKVVKLVIVIVPDESAPA